MTSLPSNIQLYTRLCYTLDNHSQASTLLSERAFAHFKLGQTHHQLGRAREAEGEFLISIGLWDQMLGKPNKRRNRRRHEQNESLATANPHQVPEEEKELPAGYLDCLHGMVQLCGEEGKGEMARIYQRRLDRIHSRTSGSSG